MQIVTDSGTDSKMAGGEGLGIHVVPLRVSLDGKTYREGIDIEKETFYDLLERSENLPITSQPSPGDFAEIYRELAKKDKQILSIHISSGLSGTVNSAVNGADLVPEADITVVDTKTLSAGAGWQVVAAARAALAGWEKERILGVVEKIRTASRSLYTLSELKYLIHGGRISHIKGLLASLLNIKPIIGVNKEKGNYEQLGQARSFNKAIESVVKVMEKQAQKGVKLTAQVLHAMNPEGASQLMEKISSSFDCDFMSSGPMSLVLGAHTGRSMVGVCFAPASVLEYI